MRATRDRRRRARADETDDSGKAGRRGKGRSASDDPPRSRSESGGPARRTKSRAKSPAKSRAKGNGRASEKTRAKRSGRLSDEEVDIGLPYLINLIANYVNESMRDDLTRVGMTVPRWTVLAALRDEDGQKIGDLSRHCLIRQSSLTRVVDQLERDGHVRRRTSRSDQRAVQVWLTPAGRALYEETVPDVVERASAAVRQLVASEMDQLSSILEQVRDSLRSDPAPLPPGAPSPPPRRRRPSRRRKPGSKE